MNQVTLLVELQQMDTRSDENATLRASLESKLADTVTLDSARADLAGTEGQTAGLKADLRALELETGALSDKLKQVGERLYSGRIGNAKELADLASDERMLQRRKSELEDRELELMQEIETKEAGVVSKRAAMERTLAETTRVHDEVSAALERLNTSDNQLTGKRQSLRARLPADTLRTYDDLRQTKKGRAVVAMKGSACSACGTAIPSGLISRVRLGNELVFCTNCARILAP
jgi:predicted  nucleic acid-binding Zn-ribbon protein